jgi:triacylglycerol lipase
MTGGVSGIVTAGPRAPSKLLWAMEVPRGAFGLGQFLWGRRTLGGPKGDGRPILILPGLVNADRSNFAMRGYLNRLGYRAYGWGLGRNLGARAIGPEGEKLFERIREIHDRTGEKVTLIGVSLGGIMARMAAHRMPDLVREVITVSSPFAGSPRATNVWRAFEWLTGDKIDSDTVRERGAEIAAPPGSGDGDLERERRAGQRRDLPRSGKPQHRGAEQPSRRAGAAGGVAGDREGAGRGQIGERRR